MELCRSGDVQDTICCTEQIAGRVRAGPGTTSPEIRLCSCAFVCNIHAVSSDSTADRYEEAIPSGHGGVPYHDAESHVASNASGWIHQA